MAKKNQGNIALAEDPSLVPRSKMDQSQLLVILVAEVYNTSGQFGTFILMCT